MSVPTGYSRNEIEDLMLRIIQRRNALSGLFPRQPLGPLRLVCSCDQCIHPAALPQLEKLAPADLSPELVGQYLGAAGALDVPQDAEARSEALAIFLHVLNCLGEAVMEGRDVERTFRRVWWFVEPEYWLASLFRTGFAPTLAPKARSLVADQLSDMLQCAIARGSARIEDCVVYLGMATDALPRVLAEIRSGRPRRHLGFWVGISGASPNSPAGMKNAGVSDFRRSYRFMDESDLRLLEDALADPATGRLIERFAFAARDPEWLGYLSRLLAWRDNTVLRNAETRAHPPQH